MSTCMRNTQAAHDFRIYGQSTTVLANFGEINYCLDQTQPQVISFQPCRPSDGRFSSLKEDLLRCTLIYCSKDRLSKEDLDAVNSKFALYDDVWTSAFFEGETSYGHYITGY